MTDHLSLLPLVTDDQKDFLYPTTWKILFLETYFSHFLFLQASYKEMEFKAVYLCHFRFVVNKSEEN